MGEIMIDYLLMILHHFDQRELICKRERAYTSRSHSRVCCNLILIINRVEVRGKIWQHLKVRSKMIYLSATRMRKIVVSFFCERGRSNDSNLLPSQFVIFLATISAKTMETRWKLATADIRQARKLIKCAAFTQL